MSTSGGRFVIQEHHARTHHFDFRLEKDGVFKSWAVPKGLPDSFGVTRLAIQVEDRELDFGKFEGTISPGEYGAGEIRIWDNETYELLDWADNRIKIRLLGNRVSGVFEILRFRHDEERKRLILKRRGQCENRYDTPK